MPNNFDYFVQPLYGEPLHGRNAFGYQGEVAGPEFTMRAYHTESPIGYVYWIAPLVPDVVAELAPYPANTLTDIVIANEVIPA